MPEKTPTGLADHAEDLSRRYAEDLDIVAGQAMLDLGIPDDQMGARDPVRNREHHGFFPGDREGGTVTPVGQITLDSGGKGDPAALCPLFCSFAACPLMRLRDRRD